MWASTSDRERSSPTGCSAASPTRATWTSTGSRSPGTSCPDWYDDWVLLERERYRQLGLHALEALSERLTAARRFGPALEAALAAVAGEPFRESAHRVLIKAHLAEGNASEAIRQYHFYRKLLNDHLGLDPSPAMDAAARGFDDPMTIR